MKKLLLFLCISLWMCGLRAQSIADARKMVYYERYAGAAPLLRSLIATDPNNAEAWWLLTRSQLHNGHAGALKDSVASIMAGNPNSPLLVCAYGQILLHENKRDSAMLYFNKVLAETKGKDGFVLLAIAQAQQDEEAGDPNYGIEQLSKAIKRDKHNPDYYLAMGNAYRKLQDGGGSYKAYQDALAEDPHYAAALYKIGKIFVSQSNAEMYLKYFNDAIAADSLYAPAWFELYYHYYSRDVNKAMDCLTHYIAACDQSVKNDYLVTDLLYVAQRYDAAIRNAKALIDRQGGESEPRLYKMIAYSYKELNDSTHALDYMNRYFHVQSDTGFVVKDYETMGEIYEKLVHKPDSAIRYFVKAEELEKDSLKKSGIDKRLADLYKKGKGWHDQALWQGRYYVNNVQATNLDLFNWGLAHYMAREYPMADSVFGIYETKYPEQDFGYYWRARSDAAIDTAMATGLAIPHYLKLIDIAAKDSANKTIRKHLIEAYGYIAAYKANTEKDLAGSIDYFTKLLDLDPGNMDARKYIEILKKNQSKTESKSSAKVAEKAGKETDR